MSVLSSLAARLRANASIQVSEYDDTQLETWITDAIHQHNRKYTFQTLPEYEQEAVVYLAWIKTCYARASRASMYYSVGGREGSVNKAEIVSNNIQLVSFLREEYITLCERIGVNPAAEIIVSDVTKFDPSAHMMTPVSAHRPPAASTLYALNFTGTEVDLTWTEAKPSDTFVRYRLWVGNSPGLADLTTVGDEDAEYNGVDTSKATLLKTYDDKWRNSCRISGLSTGSAYYFIVVLEDINGRFSVSNEVSTVSVVPVEVVSGFSWFIDPQTGKTGLRITNPEGEIIQEFLPTGA